MKSRTSGGLVKFSVAFSEEEIAEFDRLAQERGPQTSRSDVIRESTRLGKVHYAQQTRVLKSMAPVPQPDAVPA